MQALVEPDQYRWSSTSKEDQLKEAALAFIRLCAEQGEGDAPRQARIPPQLDPYTRASVARPMHPVMVRHMQAQPTVRPEIPEVPRVRKPLLKRKVLRRRPDGEVQVTDESVTSEPESSSLSDPGYVDARQRKNTQEEVVEEESESEEEDGSEGECDPNSSPESEIPYSWRTTGSQSQSSPGESQSRSTASYEQDLIIASHQKSFILPRLDQLSRNKMKTDRVARYLEHKHDWESLRLPGEDPRKSVRWSIREQMLCKSEFPPRSQHIYIPNNYLVPTEKKRSALRWGIRCDLANGVIPRHSYSS
ncbi:centriolar and ciliogenesis-associated protein HYLS1 isoform X2 [Hemicordylus capensis]|nr:centriolar and ciliogenesis-associated protein HYLS1 isoform X2 [Hemicordylus capensis]XP_053125411.1 centriolar and ciliogenesis-associated protein HYLS1 isoform X2 [Hemicordylus capensis]XP_053125412.1 centriolar and ciliogenesis-associated protein HYLS1 isoform X2 [Hemicordylus capensis]XP_053125413.1 centriolar and ciliogenesis-associated protein HYLS1 isoform X2 [Hemicordylus capensis]XP_053125414.1 centriolar and ciliogenesis-associated protein HYLS1 isoform X2 [Hemicordylus capensis]